jgi:YfiH family protein
MNGAWFLRSEALIHEGLAHAFFTRQGGVSTGVYASLNGGVGSQDDPACVAENRARMAQAIGVAPTHLLVPYQIHSADVLLVREPWAPDARPRCDGLVTDVPGLALGVTGADCGMILFADPQARVVGACHAGWKGAFTGVLEATLSAMEALGARRDQITAVLGPTIGAQSYEVGPEFVARFREGDSDHMRFFASSPREGHKMFDLPDFIGMRLKKVGVDRFENLGLDTYADPARFFSYRRTTHLGEPDYGRLVSAITLV